LGDEAKSLYEREEDKQWRKEVDHKIVTLLTSQQVLDDRMKDIEEQTEDLDVILRGTGKDEESVVEHLHMLQRSVNQLQKEMLPDALGNGGLRNRIKALESKDRREERREEYHWKFWLAVIGMLSATTVAVITNLSRIEGVYEHLRGGPPSRISGPVRHTKSRRRLHRVPPTEATDDNGAAQENLPERRGEDGSDAR
jgi:hypothetical protein